MARKAERYEDTRRREATVRLRELLRELFRAAVILHFQRERRPSLLRRQANGTAAFLEQKVLTE